MPEQLLTILKICFLILLYLFFLRVLRAVWTELRTADTASGGERSPVPASSVAAPVARQPSSPSPTIAPPVAAGPVPGPPHLLVAIEPPGLAGQSWPLSGEVRIGRADHADIRLDDSFVSADHARIVFRPPSWMLEDLGSTNGTRLNDVAVNGSAVVGAGDRIGVGTAVLEAR